MVEHIKNTDEEPLQISRLEHTAYCPRQCALIDLEQTFDENIYTIRGHLTHERVDTKETESRGDVTIERSFPLWSDTYGLTGKADVVEFRSGVPYPVEYKSGKRQQYDAMDIQLCAQGMCIEEMLEKDVPKGAIFHIKSKRRRVVEFTSALREKVVHTIRETKEILSSTSLPHPVNDNRCTHCSLRDSCLPSVVDQPESRFKTWFDKKE